MRRALALLAALLGIAWTIPVTRPGAPLSTVLVDQDGVLLGARLAADGQWRFPPAGPVPERLATALIAAEDRRFHLHPGVDPVAVLRAAWTNLAAGRVVSGASTLTMQTVRLARGNPPRTFGEKALEAVLALRLDAALSKEEVLALYAAHAPFGGNTVGVAAAAWRYYGRPAGALSWAEAATLAVLPNSPGLVHPGRAPGALRARRDALLRRLAAAGWLTPADLELALLEALPGPPRPMPRAAPHLLARAAPGHHATTLDATLQDAVTEVAWRQHSRLAGNQIHNLAALVVDVPTGEVRAWLGNVPAFDDPAHGHHVDVVTARRSTGSLLKPFLYAAMVEAGELWPDQLVPDVPLRVGGFSPENFDGAHEGAVPASDALARSRNVPAVWMLRQHGVDRFYGELTRLGMTTLDRPSQDYGLSLVLGGAEGTLLDLVGMYRRLALAASGVTVADEVRWEGAPVPLPGTLPDAGAAWATLQALVDVGRPGVHGALRSVGVTRDVAYKTGTSMGFRDGWAIAVTPAVVVGVWVGNADGEGRPELTGFQAAAPVLFELLARVDGGGWFEPPAASLVPVEVCARSGRLAGPDCAERRSVRVPRTAVRAGPCGSCTRVFCAAPSCEARAHAGCVGDAPLHAAPWFVLPAAQEAFYARHHADHRPLPPWLPGCAPAEAAPDGLTCLYPREGATVLVPRELDGEQGRVVFEAASRAGEAVHWHLDGAYLQTTTALHQLALAPPPGPHTLVLVDDTGASATRRFTVLEGAVR